MVDFSVPCSVILRASDLALGVVCHVLVELLVEPDVLLEPRGSQIKSATSWLVEHRLPSPLVATT